MVFSGNLWDSVLRKGEIKTRTILQVLLYCFLFWLPVRCALKDSGRNCLYFYPKEFLEEAQRRGLADRDDVTRRGKRFMIPYCIYFVAALAAILGLWDGVRREFGLIYGRKQLRIGCIQEYERDLPRIWTSMCTIFPWPFVKTDPLGRNQC